MVWDAGTYTEYFAAGSLMAKHGPLGNRQNCVSHFAACRVNGVVVGMILSRYLT
jgi:hypothetical protein